jgi:TonB family protein
MRGFWIGFLMLLGWACVGLAQVSTGAAGAGTAGDAELAAARTWVGRALFVRGFYGANELRYDVAGRVEGAPRAVDWTLAGMDVQAVERRSPQLIELDGVRVAIRYNPDNRLFERHPQKDEKMKVLVATSALAGAGPGTGLGPSAFEQVLGAIFSVGIDPAMQRAMPEFWKRYFDPKLAWPVDGLEGQTVYGLPGQPVLPPGELVNPVVTHKADAGYTPEAEHDKVRGTVGIRLVVDASGSARRVTIVRPLGYGLDAKAAEALAKWRFEPARRQEKTVPAVVELAEEFVLVPHP